MEFTKSEAKEWARKHYHGLDGVIQPSYTPDLESLDEEGIRHDVRHNIDKGVFSVFCAAEVSALSNEERKQFVKIVAEEAKGKVLVSMFGALDDAEQSIELLNYFESVGGTHTLIGLAGKLLCQIGGRYFPGHQKDMRFHQPGRRPLAQAFLRFRKIPSKRV